MLYYLVFDTLVALDLSDKTLQTLKPRMAESWEVSPDATTFTFHLRKDIKWQDGTPFTSKDVAYTATWSAENRNAFVGFPPAWFSLKDQPKLEAACTKDPTNVQACGGTETFAGVSTPDDYTIVFTLEAPDVFFLRSMADAPSVIMPAHLLQGQTADQINKGDFKNKTPIGTGPFTVKAIVPDQYVEFDANPDYYGGRPKLDSIFYKAVKTDTALAQLESGELDVALNVGATNFDPLSKVDILNIQVVNSPGVFSLTPNVDTAAQPRPGTSSTSTTWRRRRSTCPTSASARRCTTPSTAARSTTSCSAARTRSCGTHRASRNTRTSTSTSSTRRRRRT